MYTYSTQEVDKLTNVFHQITRAGRGGQMGLTWREAATQLWGKHLVIWWLEVLLYSLSMGGWTGHLSTVEIDSFGKSVHQLLLVWQGTVWMYTPVSVKVSQTSCAHNRSPEKKKDPASMCMWHLTSSCLSFFNVHGNCTFCIKWLPWTDTY